MFIIDGNHMDTRENAYRELKRALQAPEYMGSNLDALADVLGEMRGEIVLVHACTMLNSLREYGLRILEVLFEITGENRYLTFTVGMPHTHAQAEAEEEAAADMSEESEEAYIEP